MLAAWPAARLFREGLGDPRRQCGMVPHQQLPLVGDLGHDHGAGQLQAALGPIEFADLGAAGLGADGVQRINQGRQTARRGEKGDGDAALGKQADGLRGDLHAAKNAKAFQVGQGYIVGLGAVFIGDGHCRPADADLRAASLRHEMQALVARRPEPAGRGQPRRSVAALLVDFIRQADRQQRTARAARIVEQRQRARALRGSLGGFQCGQGLGPQGVVEGDDDAAFFRRIVDGDFRNIIPRLGQQNCLQGGLDAIGRPGLECVCWLAAARISGRSNTARTAFAVFDGHGGSPVDFDQIHGRGELQLVAGERHAPHGAVGIGFQRTVRKCCLARFVDAAVNAVALLGILARHMNAFNLHVVEQTRAIGVLRHVSRWPKRFVHGGGPSC